MLAKAPAPAVNHHLRPKRLEPEWTVALAPYNCRCLHLRQMRKWGISCSFSQSPTDNPAPAYDLMDDFVVLGPANNDPPNRNTTHRDNDRQPARTRKLAASFGRLKVHRVKSVVEKNSRMKQEVDESDDELNVQDAPPFINSQSTLEVRGNKKNANAPSHGGRASSASRSEEFRNMRRKKGTEDGIDRSGVNVKDAFEPLTDDQTKQHKPHRSDTMVSRQKASVSRGSSANAKGWGNGGGSMYDLSELPDLKQRRKFSTDSDFFSRKSFRDLGCSDYMIECLRRQLFQRPSHIQAMAFAPVVEGKTSIIADQSGSGKTLAYLAPVIQRLREEELQGLSKPLSQSPRVVILVPTAELASQVLGICRSMSKFGVPVRSMVVTGGHRQKTQLENLQQDVDILIATPGRFMYLIKEGFLQLSNLRCAVLDEVDILFNDEDFEAALESLINSSPVTTQYLFVTATLPLGIYNKLVESFPDCRVVMAPGMHRVSPGLEEVLVDCSGDDGSERSPEMAFSNKKSALLQLVEGSPVAKSIIFCNKIETCRKVENVLTRFDRSGTRVQVLPFHSALAQESRLANMKQFTNSHSKEVSQFLVCTDRASRGIDFSGVDHVILFDFPRDPSEYVRRVGRTARGAGGIGKAFIFVVGKQVSLARKITERNRKGHPVHDVPAAYELLY
ncbi:PREDICTED: DEAD-box ATP-dependent RNA [Prunus dulcis]|uniref:PREDICTED: DEAD-box ATP-dependent RNA n=1 Tax=Prunus dulcis TaxID=3755 RepID=A0A5E4GF10_PRUDU|nr:DEAD-box ATP-dependent RNA helicase 50 [Prunus dulcis]VVA38447.1 PREDICTED: DEAD-box ATP-dependent RNA [Prunus dulcis]